MPSPFLLALTGAGLLIALVVWLPLVVRRLPLSVPILAIALGALLFTLPFGTPLRIPEMRRASSEASSTKAPAGSAGWPGRHGGGDQRRPDRPRGHAVHADALLPGRRPGERVTFHG